MRPTTLSERARPWWSECTDALQPLGAVEEQFRIEIERPEWIESLDRATRLDHRSIGARLLFASGTGSSRRRR